MAPTGGTAGVALAALLPGCGSSAVAAVAIPGQIHPLPHSISLHYTPDDPKNEEPQLAPWGFINWKIDVFRLTIESDWAHLLNFERILLQTQWPRVIIKTVGQRC